MCRFLVPAPSEGAWLKQQLDRNGLTCVLTHTPVPRLTGELEQVIADHDTFGCGYIGLGWYPFDREKDPDCYAHFLETYRPIAQRIRDAGKLFMYHNHDQEFQRFGNKLVLEKLMEDMQDLMGFTLDTFWVQAGRRRSGRVAGEAGRAHSVHPSEGLRLRPVQMAVIGEGNINFDRVFEKAEVGRHASTMLVEQDDCHGERPVRLPEAQL